MKYQVKTWVSRMYPIQQNGNDSAVLGGQAALSPQSYQPKLWKDKVISTAVAALPFRIGK